MTVGRLLLLLHYVVYNFPNNFVNTAKFKKVQAAFHKACLGNAHTVTVNYYKNEESGKFLPDFMKCFSGQTYSRVVKALYNVEDFEISREQGINDSKEVSIYFSHKQLLAVSDVFSTDYPTPLSMRNNEEKFSFTIQGYTYQVFLVTAEGILGTDCIAIGMKGKLMTDA